MSKADRILIASNNAHKLQEFREIFSQFGARDIALITPRALNIELDPEETADTYVGNARIKAQAFHACLSERPELQDLLVLADDSGLEVDALGGAPGILSARYHKAAPNGDGCRALLRDLSNIPEDRRTARFRAVLVLIEANSSEHVFEGVCEGAIGFDLRGAGGFGFDPVFRVAGDARHMAELSAEEKHRISHRGVTAQKAIGFLLRSRR